jgi:RecB family exonuclease
MSWIKKLLGIDRNDNLAKSSLKSGEDICPECGNTIFSYDTYWKESCCQQCGWIVPGNKEDNPKQTQITPSASRPPKIHEKKVQNDNSKFSYSRISLFEKCPKAYHFKYLLKQDELFSTIEQHLGRAIHAALEHTYRKKDDGGNISLNSLKTAFDQAWNSPEKENVKVIKNNMTSRDYYFEGQDMLKKYYQRVLAFDCSETVALEKYFEITINDSICYRGYIDRISKNPDGMLRITDFKSGKRVNDPLEDMQLCSYALWCFEEFKEYEIEIAFEALRYEKTLHGKIKNLQLPHIKKRLIADINSVMAATEFDASPSILCDWCGYNPICNHAREASRYSYRNPEDYSSDSDECPRCGGDLEERNGRYGTFIGCTEFPDCRYTRDDW